MQTARNMKDALESADAVDREIVVAAPGALEAVSRAEIDLQIATARAYPRDEDAGIVKLRRDLLLSPEVAAACFYTLPRKKKDGTTQNIVGPTVRFAEAAARRWQHLRTQTQVIKQDSRFITAQSMAIDLETNVGHAIIAKRRILIPGEDGINVTSNAAVSVAKRNAILGTVPWTWWKPIFEDAMDASTGDPKDLEKVLEQMFVAFAENHGVMPSQLAALVGVGSPGDIGTRQLRILRGVYGAIQSGESSAEAIFSPARARIVEDEPMSGGSPEPTDHEREVMAAVGQTGDLTDDQRAFLESLGHIPGVDPEPKVPE